MESNHNKVCVFCQRGEQEVPLVALDIKGNNY